MPPDVGCKSTMEENPELRILPNEMFKGCGSLFGVVEAVKIAELTVDKSKGQRETRPMIRKCVFVLSFTERL